MLSDRVTGHVSAENIISPVTGEILCEAGQTITKEIAHSLEINAVNEVVLDCDGKQTKVISNNMVDMPEYILNKIGEELQLTVRASAELPSVSDAACLMKF